jgi:hypothetical protein
MILTSGQIIKTDFKIFGREENRIYGFVRNGYRLET